MVRKRTKPLYPNNNNIILNTLWFWIQETALNILCWFCTNVKQYLLQFLPSFKVQSIKFFTGIFLLNQKIYFPRYRFPYDLHVKNIPVLATFSLIFAKRNSTAHLRLILKNTYHPFLVLLLLLIYIYIAIYQYIDAS